MTPNLPIDHVYEDRDSDGSPSIVGVTARAAVIAIFLLAASLFQLSALLCGLIGGITGTTPNPVPSGWTITANSDGTVTLTAPTA